MYFLQTRTQIIGWYFSMNSANNALRNYSLNDRTGTFAWVSEVPLFSVLAPAVTAGLVIGIGVMLAWRG